MKFTTKELAALDALGSELVNVHTSSEYTELIGFDEGEADKVLQLESLYRLRQSVSRIAMPTMTLVALGMEIGLSLGMRLRDNVSAAKELENILGVGVTH